MFPKPQASYSPQTEGIIWVHSHQEHHIPCLFVNNRNPTTDKVLIYFHGNAEDIGLAQYMMQDVCTAWNCHAVCVEYPTYGIYDAKGVDLEQEQFEKDGQDVFDFLVKELKVNPKQIIIMGRSIGSGPATLLASNRDAGAFMLFSPLLSVYEVAKAIPSIGWMAKMFVSSSLFNNGEKIKNIHMPTFIIHGQRDEVVPFSHGQTLHQNSPALEYHKHFQAVAHMTHNDFRLYEDFIDPGRAFLARIGLMGGQGSNLMPINAQAFIDKFHNKPVYVAPDNNSSSFFCTS
jgi:acetyl esterase/lipase